MKDKRSCHDAVGKLSSEQHFVNLPSLPLLREISGALHLPQQGLMARRLTGRQNTGEIQIFQSLAVGQNILLVACLTRVQHHFSSTNAFQ